MHRLQTTGKQISQGTQADLVLGDHHKGVLVKLDVAAILTWRKLSRLRAPRNSNAAAICHSQNSIIICSKGRKWMEICYLMGTSLSTSFTTCLRGVGSNHAQIGTNVWWGYFKFEVHSGSSFVWTHTGEESSRTDDWPPDSAHPAQDPLILIGSSRVLQSNLRDKNGSRKVYLNHWTTLVQVVGSPSKGLL